MSNCQKKGNLKECKNWRGITLLSVVSKVMGRIVIDRIRTGVESKLRKEQAGFQPGRQPRPQGLFPGLGPWERGCQVGELLSKFSYLEMSSSSQ